MDSVSRQQYIQELKTLRSELMEQYRKSEEGSGEGESSPHSSNASIGSLNQTYGQMDKGSGYSSEMLDDMRSTISAQYQSGSDNTPSQTNNYGHSGETAGYENSSDNSPSQADSIGQMGESAGYENSSGRSR